MRRVVLRAGAWALVGSVVITLAAGCSAPAHMTSPGPGPGPQIFTMKMVTDHRRLDRGVLAYSALTTLQVRQATSFEVQVTDVGRGRETSAFIRQSRGWMVDRQNVPTGGTVSVQMVCGAGLTCPPRTSSARQAILRPGRSATWTWDITARSPGADQILITAVSYRGDSRVVASQTSVATVMKVRSTPLYNLEAAFDARKSAVIFVVVDLLAIAAILGAVLIVRRRMLGDRPSPRLPRPWTAWLARREKARAARPGPAPVVPGGRPRRGPRGRTWLELSRRTWLGLRDGTWLGLSGRIWLGLAAIEAAVAALVIALVHGPAAKPLSFAIIAAAAAVVLLPVYFLPVFIARARHVPDLAPVTVINVFLGWTFFGWVTALALAVRDRRPEGRSAPATSAASDAPAVPAVSALPAVPAVSAVPDALAVPTVRAVPEPETEPPAHAAYAVPRMRPAPGEPAGAAVTLVIWQTPDSGLTCQDPGDSWVHRWTYGVSPGQDGAPRFVLTGERHGCLVPPPPLERPGR
jgi:Superinfection immunity protein